MIVYGPASRSMVSISSTKTSTTTFVLMVDEASGYAVVREAYVTPETEGRNLTTQELLTILEEAWFQYFGYPEQLKLDLEGGPSRKNFQRRVYAEGHRVDCRSCGTS